MRGGSWRPRVVEWLRRRPRRGGGTAAAAGRRRPGRPRRNRRRPSSASSCILVRAQGEGVEAAALQVEQLVAQHVADGAQLAAVAVALAQQAGGGVAAAVGRTWGSARRSTVKSSRSSAIVSGPSSAREPDAERRAVLVLAVDQFGAGARARRRAAPAAGPTGRRTVCGRFVLGEAQDFPVVVDDGLLLDDVRHLRLSFPLGGVA